MIEQLLSALQHVPGFFILACGLLGLIVGSFLNVVIHRVPLMMERGWHDEMREYFAYLRDQQTLSIRRLRWVELVALFQRLFPADSQRFNLFVPASTCPGCLTPIKAFDNIPVISYLLLRGRCRCCQRRISIRYPCVELMSALLSAAAAWYFGFGLTALAVMVLLWFLLALTAIDLDTMLLPDDLTLLLLWLGLLFNWYGGLVPLHDAVIGAVAGYMFLWLLFWSFKLLTGKEGMGYGDFKLFAAIGAWMGWAMLPLVLMAASVVGAVVGISLMFATGKGRELKIPFGPYLAGGAVVALFWGAELTDWLFPTIRSF